MSMERVNGCRLVVKNSVTVALGLVYPGIQPSKRRIAEGVSESHLCHSSLTAGITFLVLDAMASADPENQSACRCLNVRIRPQPAEDNHKDVCGNDSEYKSVFVGDEGITIVSRLDNVVF